MKKALLTLVALLVAATLVSCGGGAAPEVKASAPGTPDAAKAAALSKSLDETKVFVTGFPFSSPRLFKVDDVKAISKTVKDVTDSADFKDLNKKGYKLQVVGHNDSFEKSSSVGVARAKAVINELRAYGIDAKVMVAKSVGDKEMVSSESKQNPAQRRVTFKVAK